MRIAFVETRPYEDVIWFGSTDACAMTGPEQALVACLDQK